MRHPRTVMELPRLILEAPAKLMLEPRLNIRGVHRWLSIILLASLVYLAPLLHRKNRSPLVAICWAWLIGGLSVVLLDDLLRGTSALYYPKYIFVVSPAIIVLLAVPLPGRSALRWMPSLIILCAIGLGAIDRYALGADATDDWRSLSRQLTRSARPGDIFAYTEYQSYSPAFKYMVVQHYAPSAHPVICLSGDISQAELKKCATIGRVW